MAPCTARYLGRHLPYVARPSITPQLCRALLQYPPPPCPPPLPPAAGRCVSPLRQRQRRFSQSRLSHSFQMTYAALRSNQSLLRLLPHTSSRSPLSPGQEDPGKTRNEVKLGWEKRIFPCARSARHLHIKRGERPRKIQSRPRDQLPRVSIQHTLTSQVCLLLHVAAPP